MKKKVLYFAIFGFFYFHETSAQSSVNYTRLSNATASLFNMAGSTQLINASQDDSTSELTSIGFDFWFMGVRYNSFAANSNGAVSLGNRIAKASYGSAFPFNNQPLICPFMQDLETSATGKVHFTNTGVAPNRSLIIEFLNMGVNYSSTGNDATFQVRLFETSGVIQFTYGKMAVGGTTTVSARTAAIGFCSTNAASRVMSVSHATPFTTNTTATATTVSYASIANITGLNSASNGSRVQIIFTPPVLTAPTVSLATSTTFTGTILNWIDLSLTEVGYVILKSDDGGLTYSFDKQTAANAISVSVSPLLPNKTYSFKICTLSEGALTAGTAINVTTGSCGSIVTNTATIGTAGNTNWSALAWTLGHVPTSCENAVIVCNRSTGGNDTTNIILDIDASVNSLTLSNSSTTTTTKKQFSISGDKRMEIAGNLTLTCPSANKYSRMQYNITDKTIINGNLILGTAVPTSTEGYTTIGSTGNSPNQTYIMRGDATFNKRALTIDEHTIFIFDAPVAQTLFNNTGTAVTDTFSDAILFEKLIIGDGRAPTVTFAGSNFPTNLNDKARAGVIIGPNATLVLPQNYSLNGEGSGLYFKMGNGSTVKCGGNASTDSYGVAGSNFTGGFTSYILDGNSTYEYNGSNSITQTVYNGIPYSRLVITNGSGSGRAAKQTTVGTLTALTSITINALADLFLGTSTGLGLSTSPVLSTGPLNVQPTGGLYCNANVIAGIGSFTLGNGSYLGMGHPLGITVLGNAIGNVQLTTARNFNSTANYIYNGTVAQITGNGLTNVCNDLTIDNPTTVTINTNQTVNGVNLLSKGIFDIGSTKLTINGVGILNSVTGKMKANLGILEMAGTTGIAQNIAPKWFVNTNISTLINNNTTGLTIAPPTAVPPDTMLIGSALLYGSNATNSQIITNDNITLLSRDTATARLGPIAGTNSINGKMNIERYLFAKKSWRLLASPVAFATSAFVTDAWRESGSLAATGYGTQVTGPASFVGVDAFSQRASMKYFNAATNNYIDVTNTNTTKIANPQGYYVFVRGDRAVPTTGAAGATILRIKGDVLTGNQIVNVPATKFQSFGNPYPSRIDFRTVTKTGIAASFVAWAPNTTGSYNVGAFETYVLNAGDYKRVPGGQIRNFIESGEAVFVQSNGSAGTVTIRETDKSAGSATVSRMSADARFTNTEPTLEINLHAIEPDSSTYLADGILMNFDAAYSNNLDDEDVRKILNTADNIAIKCGTNNLVVERRNELSETDTISLFISGMRNAVYKLEIVPSLLHSSGLTAFLNDRYLNSVTALNIVTATFHSFAITNDVASKANNRFYIIFKQVPPVKFVFIKAERNTNKKVAIIWKVENENAVIKYELEHSYDGINFLSIYNTTAVNNNFNEATYIYHDSLATKAEQWYKVKATTLSGAVIYSEKVYIDGIVNEKATVSIYPNPVKNKKLQLYFENINTGIYHLQLTNNSGQIINSKMVNVTVQNFNYTMNIDNVATGIYQLLITNTNGYKLIKSVLVKN